MISLVTASESETDQIENLLFLDEGANCNLKSLISFDFSSNSLAIVDQRW